MASYLNTNCVATVATLINDRVKDCCRQGNSVIFHVSSAGAQSRKTERTFSFSPSLGRNHDVIQQDEESRLFLTPIIGQMTHGNHAFEIPVFIHYFLHPVKAYH